MKRAALFLDRDGVINVDRGYVHRQADFEFIPGIFGLVRSANEAGLCVVVVTNQSGIARGLYTEAVFQALSSWMLLQFEHAGARVDKVYHCPHHPEDGRGELRVACNCRKPMPGLFLQAIRDLGIDPAQSILIGDKPSDMQAGARAGIGRLVLLQKRCTASGAADSLPGRVTVIHSLSGLSWW